MVGKRDIQKVAWLVERQAFVQVERQDSDKLVVERVVQMGKRKVEKWVYTKVEVTAVQWADDWVDLRVDYLVGMESQSVEQMVK